MAQLAAAQIGRHHEGELIGRAEAAGAGHGSDDDGAGLGQELLVVGPEAFGVVHRADGVRVSSQRAGAGHLLEGEPWPGGDDEIVVGQGLAVVERQGAGQGVDRADGTGNEADVLACEQGLQGEDDVVALAPAHRDPGVRGDELEVVHGTDDRDAVLFGQGGAQLVGGGKAAESGSHDDDVGHGCLLVALGQVALAPWSASVGPWGEVGDSACCLR